VKKGEKKKSHFTYPRKAKKRDGGGRKGDPYQGEQLGEWLGTKRKLAYKGNEWRQGKAI